MAIREDGSLLHGAMFLDRADIFQKCMTRLDLRRRRRHSLIEVMHQAVMSRSSRVPRVPDPRSRELARTPPPAQRNRA